jgi:hypothetical protein
MSFTVYTDTQVIHPPECHSITELGSLDAAVDASLIQWGHYAAILDVVQRAVHHVLESICQRFWTGKGVDVAAKGYPNCPKGILATLTTIRAAAVAMSRV